MKDQLSKISKRIIYNKSDKFLFFRSIIASQISSWVDLGLGFILFAFLDFRPWISSAIGAIIGGFINCYINYRFTFRVNDLPFKTVIIKYLFVWTGSIFLNSYGTEITYNWLYLHGLLDQFNFRPDGYYALSRLTISILVSILWNFPLLKIFVYRKSSADIILLNFYKKINILRW